MINWLQKLFSKKRTRKDADEIASIVIEGTNQVLEKMQLEINNRFTEVQSQLKQVNTNVELLERKMIIKEMHSKQDYGQLYYKLHEVKNKEVEDKIHDLQKKIKS